MVSNNLSIDCHDGNIYIITMKKAPENRINIKFAQELISALRLIEQKLGKDAEGAVIIKGNDAKFWCTGLELDEADTNPHANSDGFFPLLATLLDYPFPTIALITGHTFGGACPFALSHDYRIMFVPRRSPSMADALTEGRNSKRGFWSMPPVNLGLHFDGIGALPRLKLGPQIARKMLLEAHRWTGKEALKDGIVDEIAEPDEMLERALALAKKVREKSKMGVYALLRNELWGEAATKLRAISYVHGRMTATPAKAKI